MSLLPEAILPNYAVDSINHTRLRGMAHKSKVKIIQGTIFSVTQPHRILALYLLDFFAYCSTLHPRVKSVAIDLYCRPFMLSPNLALHRFRLDEYKLIFDFLISNAEEILGGKFRGFVIPYSGSPTTALKMFLSTEISDRPNAPREVDENTSSIEKSPVGAEDITQSSVQDEDSTQDSAQVEGSTQDLAEEIQGSAQDEASTDNLRGTEDAEIVETKSVILTQLKKSGVTESQIAKYQDHVMAYVHSAISPSNYPQREVFAVPIWISTCYASERRSAYEDFGIDVRLFLRVPIVVAECCQQVLRAASKSGGYDFNVTENSHETLVDIAETFDSFPAYGQAQKWRGYSSSLFGPALFSYLRLLPEPLIPEHAAARLMEVFSTVDTKSTSEATTDLISALAELPVPNYDTLLYLIAFFSKLHITFDYITTTVPDFTSFFLNITPTMPQVASNMIVKLLIDDMPSILSLISDMRRKKKSATTPPTSLPVNPLYPDIYVTATSDFVGGHGNSRLTLKYQQPRPNRRFT
ncbi:hypothetical protein IQ07DRAFT_317981 [Pyrenochaeta sp. DS3sAY3a]|nr:hypothetical protein IQ07DRAFT_317981 [Pyrenochaeta sp. DS3sAY3a]